MTGAGPSGDADLALPPPVLGEPAVFVDERKHPDRRHWRWWATRLGEDHRGVWLATPAGTTLRRGDEPVRTCRTPMVVLVPHGDPWGGECYLDPPSGLTYVNSGTVPTWPRRGTVVRQVDLDLDVVVRRDGTVALEDQDEFEERRDGYPVDVARLAEVAAARAVVLLGRDPEWFGGRRWLDRMADMVERGGVPTDGHGPGHPRPA